MWDYYTNKGPLVLTGSQAKAFRIAAKAISDEVGWDESADPWDDASGIQAFDSLTQLQKQVAILMVAGAALDSNIPMPDVTAVLEGTVTAVYGMLESLVEQEVEIGHSTKVRQIISDALVEIDYWEQVKDAYDEDEEPDPPLPVHSTDTDEWRFLVQSLSYELVDGDFDFAREGEIVDAPPDQAAKMYEFYGIATDYFTTIVEDPTPSVAVEIRKTLDGYLADSA